ncbi:MAG: squalene/phytoene synthase family protein [Gammaproteobacteria bacterium]|nr:squalene/phytoene synthase family protein [Gammaproteobacteria bacterium]
MQASAAPSTDLNTLCRQKILQRDRSDYYSVLFLPPERRTAAIALYAFWHEVSEIPIECSDVDIACAKLAWWHDEAHSMFAGRPRHPVAIALAPAIKNYALPETPFIEIVDELTRHARASHYDSFADLHLHAARTRGRVALLLANICGYRDPSTPAHAIELGTIQALAILLRDVGADARRGLLTLPLNDMTRFGVRDDDIFAGRSSDAFVQMMAFSITRLLDEITRVQAALATCDRTALSPLLIAAEIARVLLTEIRNDAYRVLGQRLELTPLRQLWIAWRSYRRERRHRHTV